MSIDLANLHRRANEPTATDAAYFNRAEMRAVLDRVAELEAACAEIMRRSVSDTAYTRLYEAKAGTSTLLPHLLAEARREERAAKDAAYEERNRLVAALGRYAYVTPDWWVTLARTEIEGWEPYGCIYIETPEGQLSWHFHDSQRHLFDGLPTGDAEWDGHSTEEKYKRVARLFRARGAEEDYGG